MPRHLTRETVGSVTPEVAHIIAKELERQVQVFNPQIRQRQKIQKRKWLEIEELGMQLRLQRLKERQQQQKPPLTERIRGWIEDVMARMGLRRRH